MIKAMQGTRFGLTLTAIGEGYLGEVSPTPCWGFVSGKDGWIRPHQILGEKKRFCSVGGSLPQFLPQIAFVEQGRHNPRAQMGDQTVQSLFCSPLSQGQRRHSPCFLKEPLLLKVIIPHGFSMQDWAPSVGLLGYKKAHPACWRCPSPKAFPFLPLLQLVDRRS